MVDPMLGVHDGVVDRLALLVVNDSMPLVLSGVSRAHVVIDPMLCVHSCVMNGFIGWFPLGLDSVCSHHGCQGCRN